MKIKAALAQFDSVFSDVDANVNKHIEWAQKALKKKADLIIFPELSINGYYLRDLVPDTALKPEDDRLKALAEVSASIDIIAGFVEESEEGLYYNSAVFCSKGKVTGVYRKNFLPNYSMFEEGRYFASGKTHKTLKASFGDIALVICEDAWHPEYVLSVVEQKTKLLVIMSASPVKGLSAEDGNNNEKVNETINRFYSLTLGIPVVFVNKAGYEHGIRFWGGAMVYAADGDLQFHDTEGEHQLFFVDIDLDKIKKARVSFPYMRDIKDKLFSEN